MYPLQIMCAHDKREVSPMRMERIILIFLAILLASCASQPATTVAPIPTSTLAPVAITPTAAQAPQFVDLKSGGFSLSVQPELEFEFDDYAINISDISGELIISLNGKPYIASLYTLNSFLDKYLVEMAARGGSFEQSDPYEISVD